MPNSQEEVTVTLRLPKELRKAFDNATAANDETKSQVIRRFIREYLDNNKSPKLL